MDRPDSRPEPGDDEPSEVSIDWQPGDRTRRSRWSMSLAMVAVVAILGAGIAVASALGGSSDGPDRDEAADVIVDDERVDDETVDDETVEDRDDRTPLVDTIRPRGPRDGVDSKRHPVTVTASDGLLDGQEVTVSGSEFPPDTHLGVVMCSGMVDLGGGVEQCEISPHTPVKTDAEGRFETTFPVRQFLVVGGQEIDCAAPTPEELEATCVVAVGAIDDYDESGIAPVHFDSSFAGTPAPELAVTPSTGLEHLTMVTVSLTGADDETYWWPHLCTAVEDPVVGPSGERCEPLGLWGTLEPASTGLEGDAAVTVAVQRIVGPYSEDPVDCAEAPGRCLVRVLSSPRVVQPVPVSFDPSVPAPPLPEMPSPQHHMVTPRDL